ncbi:helix-turn-helix domain-containing protein [Nitrolancea hollandica]|uniref:Winged helix-turn helix domain-containing protein n=1 Tax=Nitrolancea hollandica Lb TaxID=1129897 RepID=I4EMX1_9BACT|nr:helix-turn-helix domain-containing protein [Nitrolancea hollandica]CCF86034.1 hypothetical protein NITHO_6700001 [Nitrolancea hollandica Lb]
MPRVAYAELIQESVAELRREEKRLRGAITQPRIRMLRLLKAGQITSLRASTELLGYSLSQLYRWWTAYRQGGLARLLETHPRPGAPAKLTPAAWTGLEAELRAGRIATLRDAQCYLQEQWGIRYSLNGIWYHLHQREARPKTGRRRHRQADSTRLAAYKSRLWGARAGPRSEPGLGDG